MLSFLKSRDWSDSCLGQSGQAVQDDGRDRFRTADADVVLSQLAARLTSRVLLDLRIWMIGFGLLIGLIFPFAVIPWGRA